LTVSVEDGEDKGGWTGECCRCKSPVWLPKMPIPQLPVMCESCRREPLPDQDKTCASCGDPEDGRKIVFISASAWRHTDPCWKDHWLARGYTALKDGGVGRGGVEIRVGVEP